MINFLTYIFYSLWLIALWVEIYSFLFPVYVYKLRTLKTNPDNKGLIFLGKDNLKHTFLIGVFIETILIIIGVFSSQWLICFLMISTGFIVRGKTYKSIKWNGIMCSILIIFLLINKIFLHIDFIDIFHKIFSN